MLEVWVCRQPDCNFQPPRSARVGRNELKHLLVELRLSYLNPAKASCISEIVFYLLIPYEFEGILQPGDGPLQ